MRSIIGVQESIGWTKFGRGADDGIGFAVDAICQKWLSCPKDIPRDYVGSGKGLIDALSSR